MRFTTRAEANGFYKEFLSAREAESPEAVKAGMAELGRRDLFFLLTNILKRNDLDRDWLFDRCQEVQIAPNGYLDLWAREHYKDLDVNTEINTVRGWVRHGSLVPGDLVFGPDGNPTPVVATQHFPASDSYRLIFDDGSEIVAGQGHLWAVERRTRKRIPMAYNKPGPKRLYRETVIMTTAEIAAQEHLPDRRLAVPVNDPLDLPLADLPINPYVLGLWLGDGAADGSRIGCADHEVFNHIEAAGETLGKTAMQGQMMSRGVNGMLGRLRAMDLLGNKHIPERYLRGSADQRLSLLQGLMDTGGHCNTRGTATFVNINDALVDCFCDLAHTLGLKPRRRRHTGECNGSPYPYWQVSFQAYKELPPFRIGRKLARCKDGARPHPRRYIVGIEPVGKKATNCIQVARKDGLYLAGRSMVTTHNSTIITYGLSLQDILADPEVTIGLFSITRPNSKKFLRQIQYECEENQLLRQLYPDVIWQDPYNDAPKWSLDDGLIFKRKSNPKEATIEAHGLVRGMPTGRHYKIRVYDDVIDEENVTNPDMIKMSTEKWELSLNLGSTQPVKHYPGEIDIMRVVGTRYHYNDPYAEMMRRKAVVPRIYPGTDNGKVDGNPVLWDREFISKKRRNLGSYVFACQILQNPKADEVQGFNEDDLRYWPAEHYKNLNIYILVDPAGEKKKTSDYSVFKVVGLGGDNNYYEIEVVRDRLNLTERTNLLFQLHELYQPLGVGYEKVGMQSDIEHIKSEMERRNYRFDITEIYSSVPKNDRIRKLIPIFEAHRYYLPERCHRHDYQGVYQDLVQTFINEEFKAFPVAAHDDMLDCTAFILNEKMEVKWPKAAAKPKKKSWRERLKARGRGRAAGTTHMSA